MLSLQRTGDVAGALESFRQARRVLMQQTGWTPGRS
jgi:hypothetical protein